MFNICQTSDFIFVKTPYFIFIKHQDFIFVKHHQDPRPALPHQSPRARTSKTGVTVIIFIFVIFIRSFVFIVIFNIFTVIIFIISKTEALKSYHNNQIQQQVKLFDRFLCEHQIPKKNYFAWTIIFSVSGEFPGSPQSELNADHGE